jgi:CobW/HypB/UreG, nucleotide-binding domain
MQIGIIVNEFGEVGIDGQLIADDEEVVLEMNYGCVCCTVRADLVAGVRDLLTRSGDRLERLIVETSGLADPVSVLPTFSRTLGYHPIHGLKHDISVTIHQSIRLDSDTRIQADVDKTTCKEAEEKPRWNPSKPMDARAKLTACSRRRRSTAPIESFAGNSDSHGCLLFACST